MLALGHQRRRTHHVRYRTGIPALALAAHHVLEEGDPDDVVHRLPGDRNARETTAQGQRDGLSHGFHRPDVDHVRTGDHDLAHQGVPELEHRGDHVALATFDDVALLREINEVAQFRFGGERTVPVAPPGSDRVTERDQQSGQRTEHRTEPGGEPRGRERHHRCVLPAQRSEHHADQDVGEQGAGQCPQRDRGESGAIGVHGDHSHAGCCDHLPDNPQQQQQRQVATGVCDDRGQAGGPWPAGPQELLDRHPGNAGQCRVDTSDTGCEQRGNHRDQQKWNITIAHGLVPSAPPHHAQCLPRPEVATPRNHHAQCVPAVRATSHDASRRDCTAHISRSSSASAWS